MGTPPVSVTLEGRDELEEDARAGEEVRVLGALDCLGRRSEINLPDAEGGARGGGVCVFFGGSRRARLLCACAPARWDM